MNLRNAIFIVLLLAAIVAGWVIFRERKVEYGQAAFTKVGCAACHLSGSAPNLTNVTRKYDRNTLSRFISNPEEIYRERGKKPLNEGFTPMPRLQVTPSDADAIAAYLAALEQE